MSHLQRVKRRTKHRHSVKKFIPYHLMPLGLLDTMTAARFTFDITDPDSPFITADDS